jgi:hypothetical protein
MGERNTLEACAVAGFFALATAAYTWPLPAHVAHALPHDAGDPLLVTWLLWWSTHVTPLTARWWNAPAFFPSHGVFAFSETLLGLAPLTAPLLWLGAPPLAAYNVAFLGSFFLSGLAAYALGFVLTREHDAALVAGVAFAFSPYRLGHLNHLQMLAVFWMPLSLAALHVYRRDGRTRWAVLFAAAWLLQALTSGYFFFLFSLLVALWLLWFARRWPAKRLATLGICWFAAALLMLPLLAGYKRIQQRYGFHRTPSEIAYYSADLAGLASAPPESHTWHALHLVDNAESQLFPGATLVILFAAAAVAAGRSIRPQGRVDRAPGAATLAFYVVAAVVLTAFALGPSPSIRGRTLGIPGPYSVLMLLPGFDGIRVPARLWMCVILCLAAAASIVVSRVRRPLARTIVATLSVAGLLLDGWPAALPLGRDPGMQITHNQAIARLGLPLPGNETETMYGAIAQQRPVFNGYSGYTAPQHHALADLLDRGDTAIFQHLAASGPIEVVVRHDLDPDRHWRQLVSSVPHAAITDTTADWTAFLIPAAPPVAPPVVGPPLPIARVEASVDQHDIGAVVDGDLASRWRTDHQAGGESILVDLGSIERPAAIVMSLGMYASQFPRRLDVAISTDGAHWESVWSGDTALATYDAAIQSPREVPIRIPLTRASARYLRLTQSGNDPARGWSIVELKVTG